MRTEVTDAIGKSKGIPTWPLGIHDGGEEGYGFQVHPHKSWVVNMQNDCMMPGLQMYSCFNLRIFVYIYKYQYSCHWTIPIS